MGRGEEPPSLEIDENVTFVNFGRVGRSVVDQHRYALFLSFDLALCRGSARPESPLFRLRERRLGLLAERVRVFFRDGDGVHPHPGRWGASRLSRRRERGS